MSNYYISKRQVKKIIKNNFEEEQGVKIKKIKSSVLEQKPGSYIDREFNSLYYLLVIGIFNNQDNIKYHQYWKLSESDISEIIRKSLSEKFDIESVKVLAGVKEIEHETDWFLPYFNGAKFEGTPKVRIKEVVE